MKNNFMSGIKKTMRSVGKTLDKHSPEILIACGIVGFVSTVILVAKEAPIAKEKLDDLHEELGEREEEPTKAEVIIEEFKAVAPIYLPSMISGAVSISCIIGSYKIGSKRTAALATAYELTQSRLLDYQNKVVETIGERKEAKIRNEIAQDKISEQPVPDKYSNSEVIMTDGLSLFYDSWGGRYFRSSVEKVRKAEKTIAERLMTEMFIPLNEFYYELDLVPTKTGDCMGFTVDSGIEVIFNSCIAPDMQACMVVDFATRPVVDYTYGDGIWSHR